MVTFNATLERTFSKETVKEELQQLMDQLKGNGTK
jgi:hypothetical protein